MNSRPEPRSRGLFALYRLTLRAALRERVVLSMLALLGLLLFLLPLGLRGDGTATGELRMHIRYSLGFSSFLLAGITLWMSCASIAGDLSSKRLQMVLTKPVSRAALWWAKWLAVTTLITSLLLLCGAVTLFRIHRLAASLSDPAEAALLRSTLLTARQPVDADPVDLLPRAEKLLAEQQALGGVPPDASREQLLEELLLYARAIRHSARGGETTVWDFSLPAPVAPGEALQLAFQFDGASLGSNRIPGEWRVGTPEHPNLWKQSQVKSPQGEHVLLLNTTGELDGATRLRVEFENFGEKDSMIFFRTENGVRLYRPGGGFEMNLFRALALIAGLLSLLAAIGTSAGALFSLPVACYVTAVMIFLQTLSGTLKTALEEGTPLGRVEEPTWITRSLDQATRATYHSVLFLLRPLDLGGPLDRVARGVLVSNREFAAAFGLRFFPVLLLLSTGGILLFQRRETGGAE